MCIEFQHLTGQVHGLGYLLIVILVFLDNSKNDSKLKDWINLWHLMEKITFAFSALAFGLWPWPCMSLALALAHCP